MIRKAFIFMTLCIYLIVCRQADAKEIPYTLEDRERLVRVEVKIEEGLKAVNHRIDGLDKRIDGLDKRIDGLQGLMYVVIGAVIAQTIGIVGFVLWDRRSALSPVLRKHKELEAREEVIEEVLKDYAKVEPRLEEILRASRLL